MDDIVNSLKKGRLNMGELMPVSIYRLFETSMRTALEKNLGPDKAADMFREAGRLSGSEFFDLYLQEATTIDELFASLKKIFAELKIGIIRVENLDENGKITLTIAEDLDCSGLPIMGKTVCNYDEGFLEAIMSRFSHKNYEALEIDCWAKGDRVCRFNLKEREK
ncbi:MAG: V4R domain-containing protein [Lachnospiraceae bacterium]